MPYFSFTVEEKVLTEYTIEGESWEEAFEEFKETGENFISSDSFETIEHNWRTVRITPGWLDS